MGYVLVMFYDTSMFGAFIIAQAGAVRGDFCANYWLVWGNYICMQIPPDWVAYRAEVLHR